MLFRSLSRPKRRGQGSLIGAIFGSVGGVDAPALPTPPDPATIVEAATEAAASEADTAGSIGADGESEARRTA